jgi:hypothetical protein
VDPNNNVANNGGQLMPVPTWEDEIKHYFTQLDIGCMRSRLRPLDLADYDNVKERAQPILDQLRLRFNNPDKEMGMPKGGKPWPKEKIDRFQEWKDAGFPRGGTTS